MGAGASRASGACRNGPASTRGMWPPGLRRLVRCRSTGLGTLRNASGTVPRTSEKCCRSSNRRMAYTELQKLRPSVNPVAVARPHRDERNL
eukprot:1844880-Alexandrium_andersonii.AAC.1